MRSKKTQKGHALTMTAGRSRLEISMAAEPASVRLVRTEIMRWFNELRHRDDGLAASIAVAVSEAVGNVVRHAYPGEGSGRVEVEAQLEESTIVVSVSDGGTGMTARTGRAHNGMGLPVIGRLADGVTVVSDTGGTRLSMRFELSEEGPRRRLFAPPHERSMAAVSR
jgi:anti-sigma regulatory factor (Ser/Thr protein kinase)